MLESTMAGPRLQRVADSITPFVDRRAEVLEFRTREGEGLVYQRWRATAAERRGAIVLVRQTAPPSGRLGQLVFDLDLPDFDFFALEPRGRGRSERRPEGRPRIAVLMSDLDAFIRHLRRRHGLQPQNLYVLACSGATVLAAAWAHDFAVPVCGLTLIDDSACRTNRRRGEAGRDLSFRRIVHDAEGIVQPLQWLIGAALPHAARRFVHDVVYRTSHPASTCVEVADVEPRRRGDMLGSALETVRDFILRRFDEPQSMAPARGELALRSAGPPRSVLRNRKTDGARSMLAAATISLGSRLSVGLRLCRATGHESAATLDHIYRDRPAGVPLIGAVIDWLFLSTARSRALRQRKLHVEELLSKAVRRVSRSGKPVRIADLAAGSARYVFDAILRCNIFPEHVLLRDLCRDSVRAGRKLIEARHLTGLAWYEQADALDEEALTALQGTLTVAIVCGLYERFAHPDMLRRSLAGLAASVIPHGYLVYTGRLPHPDADSNARVLAMASRERTAPCHPRSQAELDRLVAEAGFRKLTQRVDDWGLFTVSLAQRVAW